jgi:photosystem II stability/assembly factor-like uncharacterized protein
MKIFSKVILILFTISLANNFTLSQWDSIPSGTNEILRCVQVISPSLIYAAGSTRVLKSTDAGFSWIQLTPITGTNINKIQFPQGSGNLTGWAAASSGIYKTTDGGLNWVQQLTTTPFIDMYFTDINTGVALRSINQLRRTTDGGMNYSTITITNEAGLTARALSAPNLSAWYVLSSKTSADSSFIFKSTDQGETWTEVSRTNGIFLTITFVNSLNGIIAGEDGKLKRTFNAGMTWDSANTGVTVDLLYSKYVGGVTAYAVGDNRTIIKTTNGGFTWISQSTGIATLRGIDALPNDAFAITCGVGGTILRTTNLTGVTQAGNNIPEGFSLGQNYPNPFNPETNILFTLSEEGSVNLAVFDILGKEITVLINGNLTPGNYSLSFNASNLPSGMYFYRLIADNFTETKKMILIK